jgi:hypothetical protein
MKTRSQLKIIYSNQVLKELELVTNYTFKNLLKHIVEKFKNKNNDEYEFKGYNLSKHIILTPVIRYIKSSHNKNNTYVYVNCLIYNQDIYRDFDDEEDCECDFKTILHCTSSDVTTIPEDPYVFKIAKAIDFINNLNENFVYSKYHDMLIKKSIYNKQILIDKEEAIICKREIHDCIVCYENVDSRLTANCCGAKICRICVNQIEPLKCPNCRNEFY